MKKTRNALIVSLLSMLLCFSMLLGTSWAWFTDSVTSAGNIIQSGTLDVKMHWADGTNDPTSATYTDAATGAIFNYDKWEPGYVDVKHVKISNVGSLALKYQLNIVANGTVSKLADVIDVYFVDPAIQITERTALYESNKLGTLRDVIKGLSDGKHGNGYLEAGKSVIVTIALKMQESAGNEYQGLSIGTDFSVQLLATQATAEKDSFDNTYDSEATFPQGIINYSAAQKVDSVIDTATGEITEEVTVGNKESNIYADVPTGVKIADGQSSLTLSVNTIENSKANVTLEDNEVATSIDIHVEGVAEDNTVPVQVTIKGLVKPGLNNNNIRLYHVENGVTVEMTQVNLTELDAHNEFYYNAVTGDVIVSMASFSEVAVVADEVQHWNGLSDDEFAGGDGTANNPYLIANASQLAYFRDIVDGKATNLPEGFDTSFKGKYVKLSQDIILNHHGETSNQFDPIGWGYDNAAYNRDGAAGKVFMGTFDGGEYDANGNLIGRHGIHGLWQNGWDLQDPDNDGVQDADYTYTNCGFGLFASVKDATIKNLEIKHANVTVECVEAGLVVGLAQGNCTFENLYVYSSHIANYQRPAGGVVGEVSPGFDANGNVVPSNHRFINVHVGSSCTVGSLWGDFDTPCGGVIGAYWDDTNTTQVYMNSVDVSCVLDVYNDVTAAYQWYAYRRAGMLIGNTDRPAADGKNAQIATAPFLTCENCVVIYDYWADYKYCQFTNDNNPGKNYPWVRVQDSQYNGAYSNPRYGHPADLHGHTVTSDNHEHQTGDACHEYIPFNQLYGGGQGVYGQPAHPGVTIGAYTVVYMEGDEILDVHYVVDNSVPYTNLHDLGSTDYEWVDIDSKTVTEIPAGNAKHVVLYRNTKDKNMVRFVDKDGYVITEQEFVLGQSASYYQENITPPTVPPVDGYYGTWPEWWKMLDAVTKKGEDVTVHAVYTVVYEDPDVVPDENEVVIFDENGDTGDLFKMISQGKSVVMYKDLAGNIGSASIKTFAVVGDPNTQGWVSNHARLDLDSFELVYDNDSSAGQDWTLFRIKEGASLTIGGGVTGGGKLSFVFNTLNKNSAPRLFALEYDDDNVDSGGHEIHSTLILERGVVIEMKFHKSIFNKNSNFSISEENIKTLITGHSHPEGTEEQYHPGVDVQIIDDGDYKTIRLVVNSRTTFVGNDTSATAN